MDSERERVRRPSPTEFRSAVERAEQRLGFAFPPWFLEQYPGLCQTPIGRRILWAPDEWKLIGDELQGWNYGAGVHGTFDTNGYRGPQGVVVGAHYADLICLWASTQPPRTLEPLLRLWDHELAEFEPIDADWFGTEEDVHSTEPGRDGGSASLLAEQLLARLASADQLVLSKRFEVGRLSDRLTRALDRSIDLESKARLAAKCLIDSEEVEDLLATDEEIADHLRQCS